MSTKYTDTGQRIQG